MDMETIGLLALAGSALGGLVGLIYVSWSLELMHRTRGAQQALCLLLAIHCGEPTVTAFWIIVYLTSGLGANMIGAAMAFQSALVITAPMVILLTPAIAILWQPSLFRERALGTLPWGLLRWILSLLLNISLNTTSISDGKISSIGVIGMLVLWFCMFRAYRILNEQRQMLSNGLY